MVKWLSAAPLRQFTVVSLVLILAMVLAVSYGQWVFFRDAVIAREAVVVHDMVVQLASEHLTRRDFENYREASAKWDFAEAFDTLGSVSGVVRLKVYNSDNIVVWSDAPQIVGLYLKKTPEHLARMWGGRPSEIFAPAKRPSFNDDRLPNTPLIEFYVPITVKGGSDGDIKGVVAVYRLADSLTATLNRGMLLITSITAVGGMLLFVSLFYLFSKVYRRQRQAESELARLSREHGHLVQIEKLSTIGQMISEIAHQFNNPLIGVINLGQLVEREADKPERVRELIAEVIKAGHHCKDFMQRMLRFAQPARYEPHPTELGGLVEESIGFFSLSGDRTPVVFPTQKIPVVLSVDPVLMRHALFNLIHNAALANPGGTVEVGLEAATDEEKAGWAISVSDRGPGISPVVAKYIFAPFFTTRQNGTGLGLAVAQQIVIIHGGRLKAENRQDGGARFVIWLPAVGRGT